MDKSRNQSDVGVANVTKVIAHRGASAQAPENTMCSFELALQQGADGLELDVQLTRDGELIVIHDETLNRTTNGKGYVFQHTYDELSGLDAGSWFSKEFCHARIPRLEEVLDLLKGTDKLLNIELKTGIVPYVGIESTLVELLKRYLYTNIVVSSFNHYSLRTLKTIAPDIRIGALYSAGFVEPWLYGKHLQVYSLHPFYLNIIPELVTGCCNAGIALFPWTVDKPDDMKKMLNANVEAIITNNPAVLLDLRRTIHEA